MQTRLLIRWSALLSVPYIPIRNLGEVHETIHNKPLNVFIIDRKLFAISRVQYETPHIGEERMLHGPPDTQET